MDSQRTPVPRAIDPSALKGQQHTWSASEIRGWAIHEFPNEFRALPDLGDITFINWAADIVTISLARIKDDHGHEPRDAGSLVLDAFLSGTRFNNFGLITMNPCTGEEIPRSPLIIYHSFKLRDMRRPFRYLGDGNHQSATIARFRALISYYFMLSGHVDLVGGYQDYLIEFKMACFWVANQGRRPPHTPTISKPLKDTSSNVVGADADTDDKAIWQKIHLDDDEDDTQEHRAMANDSGTSLHNNPEVGRRRADTMLKRERAKTAKAKAKTNQQKRKVKNLKKELLRAKAELAKKSSSVADQLRKEKKRADEAEAKLASIHALSCKPA